MSPMPLVWKNKTKNKSKTTHLVNKYFLSTYSVTGSNILAETAFMGWQHSRKRQIINKETNWEIIYFLIESAMEDIK